MIGINADAGLTAGRAAAQADIGIQFLDEKGKPDVQLGAGVSLELIGGEVEGSVGLNFLGGEVGVSGGVNYGIGAHVDAGYRDGVVKCDIGASIRLVLPWDLKWWRYG